MKKPIIAKNKPVVLELEPGTYHWCSCGKSKDQPFCDGSHKGSPFKPVTIRLANKKKLVLCQCKQTNNPPFCDGSHQRNIIMGQGETEM
ncbi:MAG: CDGSH iron-sulfur domain-containing protein [Fibrobacteria bacterium]|nr:CDGSH iron-sulfur domain-containing protein [Fibrobacteria bacterium]